VFRIRIGLTQTDPDPAFEVNMDSDPDQALEVNADPDPGSFENI
jgi:hypothetical protein